MTDKDIAIENYFDLISRTLLSAMDFNTYYASIVIGRYKVLMCDLKEFDNGGCVYIYKLKESGGVFGKTNIITAKQFFDGVYRMNMELQKEYVTTGYLESEVYKDKKTGEWINNGGIININMFVETKEDKGK